MSIKEINYIGLENISQDSGEIKENISENPKIHKEYKDSFPSW